MSARQAGVFAGVGLLATATHVVVALAAAGLLGAGAQSANAMGFAVAIGISYLGHANLTFGHPQGHAVHGPRFLALALCGLGLSSAITHVICTLIGAPFAVAMAVVAVAVPVFTFLGGKFWAFAEGAAGDGADLAGFVVAAAVGCATALVFWTHPVNPDTAWFLIATRKWLAGAALYVDIIEVNPPLNFYLTVPVIWLANAAAISDTHAQYIVIGVLTTVSLVWVHHLLLTRTDLAARVRLAVLPGLGAALILPLPWAMAQREHLMLIFLMPYLFGFLTGQGGGDRSPPDGGRSAMARAGFAAVGLCLKPHFMLIPLALTVVRVIEARSWRPLFAASNLVLVAAGLAYIAFVEAVHPDYLGRVVPWARAVYGDFGMTSDMVLANMDIPLIGLILAAFAAGWAHQGPATRRLLAVFLAGVAIYVVQWKGFPYQSLPMLVLATMTLGLLLATANGRRAQSVLAICGFAIIFMPSPVSGFYRNEMTEIIHADELPLPPNPAILVVSANLAPSMPLVLALNGTWTSRYPALWLLPGALNGLARADCSSQIDLCAKLEGLLSMTRYDVITDMMAGRPDLLIFDKPTSYIEVSSFDFYAFLDADPRFKGLMAGFRHMRDTNRFSVWVRTE